MAVFIAGATAAVVVPRSVEHMELPEPRLDVRGLAAARTEDQRLAALARAGLDFDLRELGHAVRRFGEADAIDDEEGLVQAKRLAGQALARSLSHGAESVAALRAYQLEVFLREVRAWLATGIESDELRAVGGAFVRNANRRGWVLSRGGGRRLLLDDAALRALFKKRWNDVVGLRVPGLEPSRAELGALSRFLLRHPPVELPPSERARPDREAFERVIANEYRLKRVDELAQIDASYPASYARGVLNFRLGRYDKAVEGFRRHLEATPDGPLALRAQNYLRASLEHAGTREGSP